MQRNPKHVRLASVLLSTCLSACALENDDADGFVDDGTGDTDDERDDGVSPRIFGGTSFSNCLPEEEVLMRNAIRLGWWATSTPEFGNCVNNRYRPCDDDQRPTVADGLVVARSNNPFHVTCDWLDNDNIGAALPDDWTNSDTEEIQVDIDFLTEVLGYSRPIVGQGTMGIVLWHELMHQHGYDHGDSENPNPAAVSSENRATCGQSPSWIWNVHSMPHTVGSCFVTAVNTIPRTRLAAEYQEPMLTYLTNLIEISLGLGGIVSEQQFASTRLNLAQRRKLRAQHSSKCLGLVGVADNDGTPVKQVTCGNATTQLWVPMPLINDLTSGSPLRYILMNAASGKCLDRPHGAVANQTTLQQHACHGGLAQQFHARASGQWEAMTNNGLSGQCLDIASESQADNATLQMSTCKSAPTPLGNQIFTLQ